MALGYLCLWCKLKRGGILCINREETVERRSKFGADRDCHASAGFVVSFDWLPYGDR